MIYLTGIHALNIPCSLDTCGDWHSTSIKWEHPDFRESDHSVLKDYGIEKNSKVEFLDEDKSYNVANHIRALLDMLIDGNYGYAQGIKEDYICNDKYTQEIFDNVYLLNKEPNWKMIDGLMRREYKLEWLDYLQRRKINEQR